MPDDTISIAVVLSGQVQSVQVRAVTIGVPPGPTVRLGTVAGVSILIPVLGGEPMSAVTTETVVGIPGVVDGGQTIPVGLRCDPEALVDGVAPLSLENPPCRYGARTGGPAGMS